MTLKSHELTMKFQGFMANPPLSTEHQPGLAWRHRPTPSGTRCRQGPCLNVTTPGRLHWRVLGARLFMESYPPVISWFPKIGVAPNHPFS